MRLGTFTKSSRLIRSYSSVWDVPNIMGDKTALFFSRLCIKITKQGLKAIATFIPPGILQFCLEWVKRRAIYMIQAELGSVCIDYTNPLFCVVQVYERKQETQGLLWFWSYFWHRRFFKSLKLHFDICNILIKNKMTIKWKDLHCRLL